MCVKNGGRGWGMEPRVLTPHSRGPISPFSLSPFGVWPHSSPPPSATSGPGPLLPFPLPPLHRATVRPQWSLAIFMLPFCWNSFLLGFWYCAFRVSGCWKGVGVKIEWIFYIFQNAVSRSNGIKKTSNKTKTLLKYLWNSQQIAVVSNSTVEVKHDISSLVTNSRGLRAFLINMCSLLVTDF